MIQPLQSRHIFSRPPSLSSKTPVMHLSDIAENAVYIGSNGIVRVQSIEEEVVKYHEEGDDSFIRITTINLFSKNFEPFDGVVALLEPCRIKAVWLGHCFDGFHNGRRTFEGFLYPFFTLETGIGMCNVIPGLSYNKKGGYFVYSNGDETDLSTMFSVKRVIVNGKTESVYPIGGGMWYWDLCRE